MPVNPKLTLADFSRKTVTYRHTTTKFHALRSEHIEFNHSRGVRRGAAIPSQRGAWLKFFKYRLFRALINLL